MTESSTTHLPTACPDRTTEPGGKAPIVFHRKFAGEDVALCGFRFRPSNAVSDVEIASEGAKRCRSCEVIELELWFHMDDGSVL